MGVRTVPLGGDVLDDLPTRCRGCVFWELGADRPPDVAEATDATRHAAAEDRVRKQAWVTAQAMEDGPPGAVLRDGDRAVGYALFAPSRAWPQRGGTVPPTSADALVLATAWLEPSSRSAGHGRLLVQAAVREALRLDLRAVEAYGDRRAREWDCVMPAAWLLHEGFEVAAEHPRYPLLRIDTGRVARWAESLEHAVEELLGRARQAPRLRPAPEVASSEAAPERGREAQIDRAMSLRVYRATLCCHTACFFPHSG